MFLLDKTYLAVPKYKTEILIKIGCQYPTNPFHDGKICQHFIINIACVFEGICKVFRDYRDAAARIRFLNL